MDINVQCSRLSCPVIEHCCFSIVLLHFMYRNPEIFKFFPSIIAAESDRLDGVSRVPYDSLNMGLSTGDVPEDVWQNRRLFFDSLGIDFTQTVLSHQVHEDAILQATVPGNYAGYDAIITGEKNLFVGVSTADCVPVLIYDSQNEAVAAIHAGWPGTYKKIVAKTLSKMQESFGTRGEDCYVSVGTCIDEGIYEVGKEVADKFEDIFKIYYPEKKKFHLRLKAANYKQLTDFGVLPEKMEISPYCTYTNNNFYFSHRKEKGKTGRMLSVIGMVEK